MRDHYDVLGVDQEATDEEIKTAYRKTALKWHPDRNFGNVEEATKQFADIQIAYEVLSVPNDRAWYDRHRSSILKGNDVQNDGEYSTQAGLEVSDLMPYFGKISAATLDDGKNGFFVLVRTLFAQLRSEEEIACQDSDREMVNYPDFGDSRTSDEQVKAFYKIWSRFYSEKSFEWADKYTSRQAPDRRVRRAIGKENNKARQAERKDYIDTVQQLVSAIRKKDFRYLSSKVSAKERHRELLESAKSQAAAARKANSEQLEDFEEQAWQRVDPVRQEELEMQEFEWVETQIECVACSKTFKNEKTFTAHERSKKHQQAIRKLKREMRKEALELDLSDDSFATADESVQDDPMITSDSPTTGVGTPVDAVDKTDAIDASQIINSDSTSDSDYTNHEMLKERLAEDLEKLNLKSKRGKKIKRRAKGKKTS